jgi:hypothetical protein
MFSIVYSLILKFFKCANFENIMLKYCWIKKFILKLTVLGFKKMPLYFTKYNNALTKSEVGTFKCYHESSSVYKIYKKMLI